MESKPTWLLVTLGVFGFVALGIGQGLLDLESMTWTELTGMLLYFSGIMCLVTGVLGIMQKRRDSHG